MTYSLPDRWEVREGDCLALMREMPEGCVDAVVTDPPYGIGFMGKAWDVPEITHQFRRREALGASAKRRALGRTTVGIGPATAAGSYDTSLTGNQKFQEWCEAWAIEAFRLAKPGAHMLVCGGPRTFHRMTAGVEDAGWEIRDCLSWLYGSGFPKSHNGPWGGTALKPAWEPVILARKPLVGTVAANHAAHGTGALNIDGCRIEGEKAGGSGSPPLQFGGRNHRPFHDTAEPREFDRTPGRWPANVALDESAAVALDAQSGNLSSGVLGPNHTDHGKDAGTLGAFAGRVIDREFGGDAGGASRFFYTAKASRSERGATNTHPTVKPVDLMRWLVRLVTPQGGIVLDPFTGSGTTGVAAIEEGCCFLGMEREAEYVAIARARIGEAAKQGRMFTEERARCASILARVEGISQEEAERGLFSNRGDK